jgi:hypothetical protein
MSEPTTPITPITIQGQFFNIIQARFARKSDAIDVVCQLLNSTKDPVYRRIRGETALTPEELKILAQHFHISLDELIYGKSAQVVCSFDPITHPIRSFEDYLTRYESEMKMLAALPDVQMFYTCADIPVFTYMFFPEIIAFKLYVWGRTTWNFDYLREQPFDFSMLPPHVEKASQEVLKFYLDIPSVELWSLNIVDNTLNQIENTAYSRNFKNPTDALILCDKLVLWAKHHKKQAIAGKKMLVSQKEPSENAKSFQLYNNEILHANNTVFVKSSVIRGVYSAFCSPNFLKTMDEKACTHIENWFGTMIDQADPISGGSRDKRDWYFNGMTARIEAVRKRIEVFLEKTNS